MAKLDMIKTIIISLIIVSTIFVSGLFVMQGLLDTTPDVFYQDADNFIMQISTNKSLAFIPSNISVQTSNDTWLGFDGINDQVTADDIDLSDGGTVSAWLSPNSLSGTPIMITSRTNENNTWGISLDNSTWRAGFYNGSTYFSKLHSATAEWQHVAFTYNATNNGTILYVNGNSSEIPGNINALSAADGILAFSGRTNDPLANPSNGSMDETRIYNRVLSESEILEIYNSGRKDANSSITSTNLTAWYSFNEGTGTTLFDKSSYGNNGTISGASWNNTGTLTLVENTDYALDGSTFYLLDSIYDYKGTSQFDANLTERDASNVEIRNTITAMNKAPQMIAILLVALMAGIIIAIALRSSKGRV